MKTFPPEWRKETMQCLQCLRQAYRVPWLLYEGDISDAPAFRQWLDARGYRWHVSPLGMFHIDGEREETTHPYEVWREAIRRTRA